MMYSDMIFTELGQMCFDFFQTFIHENHAVEKFVQENRLLEGNINPLFLTHLYLNFLDKYISK